MPPLALSNADVLRFVGGRGPITGPGGGAPGGDPTGPGATPGGGPAPGALGSEGTLGGLGGSNVSGGGFNFGGPSTTTGPLASFLSTTLGIPASAVNTAITLGGLIPGMGIPALAIRGIDMALGLMGGRFGGEESGLGVRGNSLTLSDAIRSGNVDEGDPAGQTGPLGNSGLNDSSDTGITAGDSDSGASPGASPGGDSSSAGGEGGDFARGGRVPGKLIKMRRGGSTDTVRAMLTPGEEIIPRKPAAKFRPALQAIERNQPARAQRILSFEKRYGKAAI